MLKLNLRWMLLVTMSACSAHAMAQSSAAKPGYELVLELKPENPAGFMQRTRGFYDICAAASAAQHLPVKPPLTLTKDFAFEVRIYVSDGKRYYEKTEGYTPTLEEQACEIKITKGGLAKIYRDGKIQTIDFDEDGHITPSTPERSAGVPGDRQAAVAEYTQKKTIQGMPVRCLPKTHPTIAAQLVLEFCIYDGPGGTTLWGPNDEPQEVYARMPPLDGVPSSGNMELKVKSFKPYSSASEKLFSWVGK